MYKEFINKMVKHMKSESSTGYDVVSNTFILQAMAVSVD